MTSQGEQQELPLEVEPDRGPFWAYVRVTSFQLQSDEIAEALGIEPDESHDKGDSNPYREGGIYKWSKWSKHLVLDDAISMGTEGLSEAIEALGDELADRLAELAKHSCEVAVMVVQELDEQGDTGIHLTAGAIRWLARAGAFFDVDQYVLGPRGDEE
jgi:hypothetical protein